MSKKRAASDDEVLAYSESKKSKIGISKSVLIEGSQQNLQNEAYTVGWICAITTEYVAAQAFLDEKHDGPEHVHVHDENDYTLGRVGKHNVVIAVLPNGEYGISSAAGVASDMLHTFPNIRIGLMVGIGGGAPTPKHDIRLGDIVVSAPCNGKGGVIQYDFGKNIQDQSFQLTRFLNQPPKVLRAAMSGLKAKYELDGHQIDEAINRILEEKPRLKKYKRPSPESDRLYQSTVKHPPDNEKNCTVVCGDHQSDLRPRDERAEGEDNPAIHYGLIASANQLMENALLRDKLAEDKGVLCFETEAAGLVNQFPCLVIRGICDYSDTHKNERWQGYAAMAAAAYAKDILCRIAPNKVEAEKKISDLLLSVKNDMSKLRCDVQDARSAVQGISFEQKRGNIESWLSPSDPSTNYNKALQQRQEGTGCWFLSTPAYFQWKTQRNSSLWLYGIPGCGKTILSSTIIEDLDKKPPGSTFLYFYFDFSDIHKQTLENMVRSLIGQLYSKCENTRKQLDSLFSSCERGRRQPKCESLCQVLSQMLDPLEDVYVVLDALDECCTRMGSHTEGLLSWIRDLLGSRQRNVHLLVTSRPEQDIQSKLNDLVHEENRIHLQSNLISDDIYAYIHTRVREGDGLRRWRERPEVQDEIEAALVQKANGMFRWVTCQIDALENCLEYRSLKRALVSLPKTLDETYSRILQAIPSEHKQYATIILQLITFSERPLTIEEAVDAIAVDTKGKPYFDPKYRMPNPQEISRYCSSLVAVVSITEHSNRGNHVELQLAHFSVKEYLMSTRLDSDIAHDFQESTAGAAIAKTCLAYLLHFNQKIPRNEIVKCFPFAQYSARFWMRNAVRAKDSDNTVLDFIEQFFCDQKCSYEICYSLYRPDLQFNGPYEGQGNPAPALYYAAFGGLLQTVNCLLNRGTNLHFEATSRL
ncbi:purine and uridine phosphorylase [Lindgomyces ingoldianus]|uniref:Purine and uridine phosphorylase n=1 Tax=Lindgomyces ingoldianus TaxID=673940 RepID=A0ACB6R2E5_9PLEO|nr:purine and uridine phosphorylase [Lindgomyces ingoldianus]KAF2473448.1 purine and uridine phosphorylase [Lindgomyces ingoldianus]